MDVTDMAALQNDVTSLPARQMVALLKTAAEQEKIGFDALHSDAAKLLIGWDASITRDSAAAALYEVWLSRLKPALRDRLVPEAARKIFTPSTAWVIQVLSDPAAAGLANDGQKTRDQIMDSTLRDAVSYLTTAQGNDSSKWQWGKLHTVRFRHPLDLYPGAAAAFDHGPDARPGDGTTVDATSGTGFSQSSGASYREIFDLGNWDRSLGVNTPGESGEPGSPHYADLLPLWLEGEYFPMSYSRAMVEKNATETLELVP
jgi:penicillin amidase